MESTIRLKAGMVLSPASLIDVVLINSRRYMQNAPDNSTLVIETISEGTEVVLAITMLLVASTRS